MKCPHCGNVAHKHGKTNNKKQRYKCSHWLHCGKNFTEVTEVGDKKVFIINCPKCAKETEGSKFGKMWHIDKKGTSKGESKPRYLCSECGTVTVNLLRDVP